MLKRKHSTLIVTVGLQIDICHVGQGNFSLTFNSQMAKNLPPQLYMN